MLALFSGVQSLIRVAGRQTICAAQSSGLTVSDILQILWHTEMSELTSIGLVAKECSAKHCHG